MSTHKVIGAAHTSATCEDSLRGRKHAQLIVQSPLGFTHAAALELHRVSDEIEVGEGPKEASAGCRSISMSANVAPPLGIDLGTTYRSEIDLSQAALAARQSRSPTTSLALPPPACIPVEPNL